MPASEQTPRPSHPSTRGPAIVLALLLSSVVSTSAIAQEPGAWRLTEFNDPGNRGAMTARLTYGGGMESLYSFEAVCDARSSTSVASSSVTVRAEAGALEDASEVELRFTAPGVDQGVSAFVFRSDPSSSQASFTFEPVHDDAVWSVLAGAEDVAFGVPGLATSSLDLRNGKDVVRSFIAACRIYQEEIMPAQDGAAPEPAAVAGPSFSCLRPLNPAEQRICANPALADRDRELAGLYDWIGLDLQGGDRSAHEAEQARWTTDRDACGPDDACLAAAYEARIGALNQ